MQNNTIKIPVEALFLDWNDAQQYRYRSESMEHLGIDNKTQMSPAGQPGVADIHELNLAHRLIAKGFQLNHTVKYLLDTFTLQNTYG